MLIDYYESAGFLEKPTKVLMHRDIVGFYNAL